MHLRLVHAPGVRGQAQAGVGVRRATRGPGPQVRGLLEAHPDLASRRLFQQGTPLRSVLRHPALGTRPALITLQNPTHPLGPPHLLASRVILQGQLQAPPLLGPPRSRCHVTQLRLHLGGVARMLTTVWAPCARQIPRPAGSGSTTEQMSRPLEGHAPLGPAGLATTPPNPPLRPLPYPGTSAAPGGPSPCSPWFVASPVGKAPASALGRPDHPGGRAGPQAWPPGCPGPGPQEVGCPPLTRWVVVVSLVVPGTTACLSLGLFLRRPRRRQWTVQSRQEARRMPATTAAATSAQRSPGVAQRWPEKPLQTATAAHPLGHLHSPPWAHRLTGDGGGEVRCEPRSGCGARWGAGTVGVWRVPHLLAPLPWSKRPRRPGHS